MIRSKEEDLKFFMFLLAITPVMMFLITLLFYFLVPPLYGPWQINYKLLFQGNPVSVLMALDLLLLVWSYFWGKKYVHQIYNNTVSIFKTYMVFMLICPISASMFFMLINMLLGSLGYAINWYASIIYTIIFVFVAFDIYLLFNKEIENFDTPFEFIYEDLR